jgi:2,3-bisphosphoglycerate-independent phosphoglycerate mutase
MATLILFFDGIGLGRDDPSTNPFAAANARRLAPLAGRPPDPDAAFRPLDATLGVPGLPQSATGQTTLYTGINAARHAGRHVQGLPGPTLRPLLESESLFLKLVRGGRRPTFANAYNRAHLEARRPRWSATTRMVQASGVRFRMLEDERADRAIGHDYTGEWFRRHGIGHAVRDAAGAARVLAGLLQDHDLVLYEYFLTDLAGHRGSAVERLLHARRAEDLVEAVLAAVDLDAHRVVVVSDHGNLEDGTHDRHTRNPAPLLAWGRAARELVDRIPSPEGFTPALLAFP